MSPKFGSPEHRQLLMEGIAISKSGYGGVLPNGNIVDRREFPHAIPIPANSMFGTPEPLPLPMDEPQKEDAR